MNDRFESCLREHGYRLTTQRRDVFQAVERLRHATPERIADDLPGVDTSTVYRALDVLVEVGLVTHTHIGHGPPTYHAVDPVPHLHLVCQACGKLSSAEIGLAAGFLAELLTAHGFAADLDYMSVPGLCADCRADD